MTRRYSLATISFLNILITAFLFTAIIGFAIIQISQKYYDNQAQELETTYIQWHKRLVTKEVERVIEKITHLKQDAYTLLHNHLKENVAFVDNLYQSHYPTYGHQVMTHYAEALEHFNWGQKKGYFYLFDANGTILYHGGDHHYEKRNIFEVTKENEPLRHFIEETVHHHEHFGSYLWDAPDDATPTPYKTYAFAKRIDPLGLYIVANIETTPVEEDIINDMIHKLKHERFGENDYGYFWVQDIAGRILMHPLKPEFNGKNMIDFQTTDGTFLFQKIQRLITEKGAGYVHYTLVRPDTHVIDNKVSFVKRIPESDLVIGSGFYQMELKALLAEERDHLKDSIEAYLQKVLVTLGVLILGSLGVAWLVSRRIHKIETSQNEYLNMLEQYKMILDHSAVVSKTTPQGEIIYINDSFSQVSGYSKEEIIGKHHNVVRHPESPKKLFKQLWKTIKDGHIWKGVIKNRTKDGHSYYNQTTIIPIKNSKSQIVEFISSGADVTETIENRNKLQNIYKTDALTGLGNRVKLIQDVSVEIVEGTLALLNIDRFKEINEAKGHAAGDKIIKELAKRLFNHFLEDAYSLYRVQADVFAIYGQSLKEREMMTALEAFISHHSHRPYIMDRIEYNLSYSAGMTADTENPIICAEIALNEAKRRKLPIVIYDDSMANIEAYQSNLLWVNRLHAALLEDRILPYYQPIYSYKNERIEKYECLMRMTEEDGIISPNDYLPISKRTKLYPNLAYRIILKAFQTFATLPYEFSINLCVEDLLNTKLMEFIDHHAQQHHLFHRLVIEIVESEEMEDNEAIAEVISRFKAKGAKIAIDDFGSGYSNYDYLTSLQADYIKIDGSIVKHLIDDIRTQDVVRSIVKFAQVYNIQTIAEFVSDQEIDTVVRSLGIDFAQGYYYGKPKATPQKNDEITSGPYS